MQTTIELARHPIPDLPVNHADFDSTSAWSPDDEAPETQVLAEHVVTPVKRSLRARIGHVAYWLTHGDYRAEVADRARELAQDVRAKLPPKLVVPHPRTRDFRNATDRRRHTGEFARDIVRHAQVAQYINLAVSAMTLFAVHRLNGPSATTEPSMGDTLPIVPIPLQAVEVHLPTTDGQEPGDDDIITRIVPAE